MGDPIQLKDEGNNYFQAGDIDKAIDCYTKATKVCKDKKVLAVIYRNRSACYLKKVSNLVTQHINIYTKEIIFAIYLAKVHIFYLDVSVFLTGKLCQCSI